MTEKVRGTQGYAEEADDLFVRYESFDSKAFHMGLHGFLPLPPAQILDIGAGTGRDAAWFARAGYSVTAVEPSQVMRMRAMRLHPSPAIEWIDDSLPGLETLTDRGAAFDVVQLSAVWMHLDTDERRAAMPRLARLLKAGGVLMMLVRRGPVPEGRIMFEVPVEETLGLAASTGLRALHYELQESAGEVNRRAGVIWMNHVFQKPL